MSAWTSAWDRPRVDFTQLVELCSEGRRPLHELLARLPRGVLHAESVAIVVSPPEGFLPLEKGSPWLAQGRSLAVVTDAPEGVLRLLGELGGWAARARSRLRGGPVEDPSVRAGWGMDLELDAVALAWLDAHDGWADVADAVRFVFAPVVRVAPDLRPSTRRTAGERVGALLVERWRAPLPILAAATPVALETLSPYVRDLGHALDAWAAEHPEAIVDETLRAPRALGRPDDAAGALFAAAALSGAEGPELLAERRAAERSQGLEVFDEEGVTSGLAQLERLAAPDPRLDRRLSGTVGVVLSQDGLRMEGALEVVVDEGLVSGLGLLGFAGAQATPLFPQAIVTDQDAYALPGSTGAAERATEMSIPIERSDLLSLRGADHPSAWIPRTLGKLRRSAVLGNVRNDLPVVAAFAGADPSFSVTSRQSARAVLDATVVLVSQLSGNPLGVGPESRAVRVSSDENRPSKRRFRV